MRKVKFKRLFFDESGQRWKAEVWHENVPNNILLPPDAIIDENLPESETQTEGDALKKQLEADLKSVKGKK